MAGLSRAVLAALLLAAPVHAGRFAPRFAAPGLPFSWTPEQEELDVPAIRAVSETQELVRVGNDDDGIPSRYSLRIDSSGRVTHLEFGPVGQAPKVVSVAAMMNCSARGSARIDRRRNCGVEIEHARGDASAVRLVAPGIDPANGGNLVLIHLKHYAILGSHTVGEYWMRIRKDENGLWRLYAYGGPSDRPLGGLFIHRVSRGIGSITGCLDSACPAEWAWRGRARNEGLPPVWPQQPRLQPQRARN